MALFSVILLLVTPILLMAALAVRFAGNRQVLNSIDYSTITDLRGLNRWAGNRLLALPLLSWLFGYLSLYRAALGIIGAAVVVIAAVLIVVWIAAGSDKFRTIRQ